MFFPNLEFQIGNFGNLGVFEVRLDLAHLRISMRNNTHNWPICLPETFCSFNLGSELVEDQEFDCMVFANDNYILPDITISR